MILSPPPGEGARWSVTVEREGEQATVWVRGELDLASAPELQRCLGKLVESDAITVVVDLVDLGFIDSAGIAALISGFNGMTRRGGRFCLRSPRPSTLQVLEIMGIDKAIPII